MVGSSTIQVFCRIRPPGVNPALHYRPEEADKTLYTVQPETAQLQLRLPPKYALETTNRGNEYNFTFNYLFPISTKQENVFEQVAKPKIEDMLSGYNATIFAYGQTGSGKTYTMTGGTSSYAERGILPRSLEYLYRRLDEPEEGETVDVQFSYMQIYQGTAYDLLSADARQNGVDLSSLNKVTFMEDGAHQIHLCGLIQRPARTVNDALEILFLGDCNRVVTATMQNNISSRSHSVFTIYLTRRRAGANTTTASKLHFVDLAGSERVSRTLADGRVLHEAKYINSSLFQLERVIHALNSHQQHIPYRSSLVTLVLRDSLGGNCKAAMLACLSVEPDNLADAISTCRFAIRVAEIQNRAVVNEGVDLRILVAQLKAENRALRSELAELKGLADDQPLSEKDVEYCRETSLSFLLSDREDIGVSGQRFLAECTRQLRLLARQQLDKFKDVPNTQESVPVTGGQNTEEINAEIERLRLLVQQRDTEIEVLVETLERLQQQGGTSEAQLAPLLPDSTTEFDEPESQGVSPPDDITRLRLEYSRLRSVALSLCEVAPESLSDEQRVSPALLFDIFQQRSRAAQAASQDQAQLQQMAEEARSGAERLSREKQAVERSRQQLEEFQRNVWLNPTQADNQRFQTLRQALMKQRNDFQERVTSLKQLRASMEALQVRCQQHRTIIRREFDQWISCIADILDVEDQAASMGINVSPR